MRTLHFNSVKAGLIVKIVILTFIGLVLGISAKAQDIHFSQWTWNPLQFNPAMTGVVNANLRMSVAYRDQWQGLAPFTTYKAAADGTINLKDRGKTKLAIGGYVFKDKAGDVELSNFQFSTYVGAIMELNNQSDLSVAINGGLFQRSLNNRNMIWDSQYIAGEYDPANPTNEDGFGYSVNSGDVGLGAVYRYQKGAGTLSSNDFVQFIGGLGLQHVNRPNLSVSNFEDRMYRKFTAHADLHFGVTNTNFSFRPGLFFARQGPHKELVFGSYYSILVREASKRTGFISAVRFSLGTHVRLGDAIIPSAFIEVAEYKLGVSYDVTYSTLNTANQGKGGFEITFIYTNPATFYYKRNQPKGTPLL